MFRRLEAIEIAEGALLADIAVVFQVIATYIPIGGDFFRALIIVVFTVLVLRRSLYVGIMGMLVSLFLVGVMLGPQFIIAMALTAMGGLFLGFTMKYRFHHVPLLLLGISGGAFSIFILAVISFVLTGLPVSSFLQPLQRSYHAALPIIDNIALKIHLAALWHQALYPLMNVITTFLFTNWLLFVYLLLWLLMAPFVTAIYIFTNFIVRQLGYTVRPFPGGLLNRVVQSTIRLFLVEARKRERFWLLRFLAKDVQRTSLLIKKSLWPLRRKSYKA
jgi:hypothetical protein